MNITFLQIFLLLNAFLIGVFTSIAIRHAYAHFKPHQEGPEAPSPHHITRSNRLQLPLAIRQRLLLASQSKFQSVLDHSASDLAHNLKATSSKLDSQLNKLGTEIINDEMKRYHKSLDELSKQTEDSIFSAQTEISTHQAELKTRLAERQAQLEAKLNDEIAVEKQQLAIQLDAKLGDAVTAFLIETLGHDVDLGAQNDYLTAMLEKNKAELIKEITDET
jgi:hypothetical protein